MGRPKRSGSREVRGLGAKAQSLASVIQETFRLWRKHHLGYNQTKYVVEEARHRLGRRPISSASPRVTVIVAVA
jgi:hypothetical protein